MSPLAPHAPLVEVAIPMRDAHGHTRHLVDELVEKSDFDWLRIYDNGSTNPNARRWLDAVEAGRYRNVEVVRWGPARGLYAMWNDALRRAMSRYLSLNPDGATTWPLHLAILNNDLFIPENFLEHLSAALAAHRDRGVWITYPDWPLGWPHPTALTGEVRPTSGTRNAGGMSGYAFLVDVARWALEEVELIDEGYVWLAGDGDLVWKVERAGGTAAAVEGLPVGHLEKVSFELHASWTVAQGRLDMKRSRQPGRHNAR